MSVGFTDDDKAQATAVTLFALCLSQFHVWQETRCCRMDELHLHPKQTRKSSLYGHTVDHAVFLSDQGKSLNWMQFGHSRTMLPKTEDEVGGTCGTNGGEEERV
jgi:hypothetical protein